MENIKYPNLTAQENDFLQHVSMFGSDGYPILKVGKLWKWTGPFGGMNVFVTKRACVAAIETFLAELRDKAAGRDATAPKNVTRDVLTALRLAEADATVYTPELLRKVRQVFRAKKFTRRILTIEEFKELQEVHAGVLDEGGWFVYRGVQIMVVCNTETKRWKIFK